MINAFLNLFAAFGCSRFTIICVHPLARILCLTFLAATHLRPLPPLNDRSIPTLLFALNGTLNNRTPPGLALMVLSRVPRSVQFHRLLSVLTPYRAVDDLTTVNDGRLLQVVVVLLNNSIESVASCLTVSSITFD